MLEIEVDNHISTIVSGRLTKQQYKHFKRALGYKDENEKYIKRKKIASAKKGREREAMKARMADWDGYRTAVCYDKGRCRCYNKHSGMHFPSGLLSAARQYFADCGLEYRLIDVRSDAKKSHVFEMSEDFEYRDYQIQIRDTACERGRGIIKVATGGGKTGIAASIVAELGVVPFVFYVTSCDLLKQARDELQKFITWQGSPIEVGAVGAGQKDIKDVTVMTVQTAVRALGAGYQKFDEEDTAKDNTDIEPIRAEICDLIRSAKGYAADECQHWAAATCQVISDASQSAFHRFGLSATPWRDAGDDILIDGCFGRPIADISASFLIERGYLLQPEIFFIHIDNMGGTPYKSYQKIYKHALKENTERNAYIASLASDLQERGKLPLILVKHIDHGKLLQRLIPDSVFLHGTISKKKRSEHLDKMRERDCGVTIATSIFDEGIDVKPLDALLLAGGGKSPTRALQRIGRILRPYPNPENNTKETPLAIDFYDKVKYLDAHSEKRLKIYGTEELFKVQHIDMVI